MMTSQEAMILVEFTDVISIHPGEALPCPLHPTGASVQPVETAKQRALHSIFFPGLRSLRNLLGLTDCHVHHAEPGAASQDRGAYPLCHIESLKIPPVPWLFSSK
ncbi:hypothetical protein E5288_WYG014240 [Bos mutus]|uniref:Uncharacterized protein n=1 Tax=Bos mutus TaxID=72004 RepID=A0A6B0R230_9CETA|nr:hypothetical protein [Bos mutus]